jgi:hypothetical protein
MKKWTRQAPARSHGRRSSRHGGSALEMALLLPWYLFLFVGAFDWGFYAHALISTESAARVAVLYSSASTSAATDTTGCGGSGCPCEYALEELRIAVNVGSSVTSCSALPVIVTPTAPGATNCADGQSCAQVAVTYQTIGVIPIPGLLQSQPTFYRVVQMRLRS